MPANHAIKRQQIEQTDHRFRSLYQVGHRLGVKRMDHPDERDRKSQPGGRLTETSLQSLCEQCAPDYTKQRQRCQYVNREVERVVAPEIGAAYSVVDRQRQTDQRARDLHRRKHRSPGRPELPDR